MFILTFFLGAAVGSFVNVLIDRSVAGEDWMGGRSRCDNCRKVLAWYDMIPIVSWAIYRGRSRCCHTPLPYRHPLVEGLTGLLFSWWLLIGFWFFRLSIAPLTMIQPAFWLLTGIILLILAITDARHGVVLTPVVYAGIILTLCYRLVLTYFGVYQTNDLLTSFLMAAGGYGFFWLLNRLTRGRGMAEGDIDVALYLGLLLGWPRGILALGMSFVMGAIVGVTLIATKLKTRHDTLPFVPFMVTSAIVVLLFGEWIIGFLG